MVKITALMVLKCTPEGADPVILANASDLSSFGFFQRPSVKEFIVFVGRTVAKRTPPGQRQSVQHEEYKVHSYNQNGLCALGFMDDHYPVRSAFSLLNKVLEEYQKNFGDSWKTVQADNSQQGLYLNEALSKFQDPAEADKLLKIQRELDETKIILHKTIDSVLARGEKLDSLVEKSSDLSAASQVTPQAWASSYGLVRLDPNLEMSNHDWAESVNILGSQAEFDSLANSTLKSECGCWKILF
ncbi:UNVERIFIED_CONTAM: VAMP-like protein YKT61 [Sesamum angustifolium]|uniref:VAMP-like protein YKT61 n=1 Tax=Sesamum angustifolium TaxID=2727405 RepID=A0AAW2J476_9LAMI